MRGVQTQLWVAAVGATLRRQLRNEWFGGPLRDLSLAGPRAEGFAAAPPDLRPADPNQGQALLDGVFILGGERLAVRPGGQPWDQPSPSRRFAERLHRFDWLRDLLSVGEPGVREALRLTLEWERAFGRWNSFSWTPNIVERRAFNLACAAKRLAAPASDLEVAILARSLARQARFLLRAANEGPARAAERACAAAVVGAALAGEAGERLMRQAGPRLESALAQAVLPDGGHASRSPQAGLALLFDLLALDDALSQRGRPPAEGLSRAIDRLSAASRFLTLPDGRLACFQGGEAGDPAWVAAALAHDDAPGPPPRSAAHTAYERLIGPTLQVMADVGAPATGGWSVAACGQPLAIEVVCGRDRLITNTGWSPDAARAQALRLAAGGSTVALGDGLIGRPLRGYLARALGPRLVGGAVDIAAERRETDTGVWLEMANPGWRAACGLIHERRLYLDKAADELRGEDRFVPGEKAGQRLVPVAIHFHLRPDVRASLARDQRSVLLRGPSNVGWWLRNDAGEVSIEPSVHFIDGRPQRTSQVVLRGRMRADRGGRVRWKLTQAEGV